MIQQIVTYASSLCIGGGILFCFAAVIGLIRFPDTYTRLHAGTKALTGGAALILIGLLPLVSTPSSAVRIMLILVFYLATNPLSNHAIARACRLHDKRNKKIKRSKAKANALSESGAQ